MRICLKILYSNFLFIHHEAEVGIWFYIVKTAIQAEICVAKCLKYGAFCFAIQSNSHPACSHGTLEVSWISSDGIQALRSHGNLKYAKSHGKCKYFVTRMTLLPNLKCDIFGNILKHIRWVCWILKGLGISLFYYEFKRYRRAWSLLNGDFVIFLPSLYRNRKYSIRAAPSRLWLWIQESNSIKSVFWPTGEPASK